MKRMLFVATAALALLVPTLTFAQVKTVYIPGSHPRVEVVQPNPETPVAKVEKAPPTPAQVIRTHQLMAAGMRGNPRMSNPAATHCDRLIAKAQAELLRNF